MADRKSAFNLETCARPNILALEPYRCARDDYADDGVNILLDANENAYGPSLELDATRAADAAATAGAASAAGIDLLGLHRYPDPHQAELKQLLCDLRNTHAHTTAPLTPANVFVGVGSDEAIDALLRTFCVPGRDKILTCPPTYGMYSVSAATNDVEIVKVPLTVPGEEAEDGNHATPPFSLRPAAINAALAADPAIKLVYVCSPGNPTASLVRKDDVAQLLRHPTWNGVVVVDEAYVDFAADARAASLAQWVTAWPNLVVLQTLSKAFGLAGIRLGAAFASPPVARLLNSLKAPYNVSSPTSALARRALAPPGLAVMRANVARIAEQRARLLRELARVPGVGRFLGGTDANFLLVEILDRPGGEGRPCNDAARRAYQALASSRGVVVRFRGAEHGCTGCLRITVGTEREVTKFLDELRSVLGEIYGRR
ncbi:histidinol-phosphate transaminase [Ascosphaera acerosa]|nr:histidinol-phosphate transaminase [Ascosphaera acerosa]